MWSKKRESLLGLLLLLVIVLQGMIPFLHAHTGLSSLSGIHTPDSIVSYHHTYQSASPELASTSPEESFVVQVGSVLSNEDERLKLGQFYVRNVFFDLKKPAVTPNLSLVLTASNRAPLSIYSSEAYPPPGLAPPTHRS
jgi:hypothetical protein